MEFLLLLLFALLGNAAFKFLFNVALENQQLIPVSQVQLHQKKQIAQLATIIVFVLYAYILFSAFREFITWAELLLFFFTSMFYILSLVYIGIIELFNFNIKLPAVYRLIVFGAVINAFFALIRLFANEINEINLGYVSNLILYLILFIVLEVIRKLSTTKTFLTVDSMLIASLALYLGGSETIAALIISILLAGCVALWAYVSRKMKIFDLVPITFPLLLGYILALGYTESIINSLGI